MCYQHHRLATGYHNYEEKAAAATNKELDAAGHTMETTWAVFKIWKAIYLNSVLKPTALLKFTFKAAATDF